MVEKGAAVSEEGRIMITLKPATAQAVRYACLNFHYAKAVPAAYNAYNVYNDRSEWCGVIIFGGGRNPKHNQAFRDENRRSDGTGPGSTERKTAMYVGMCQCSITAAS